MTSCGDIDLLRDLGPVWEPEFSPIGSFVNYRCERCNEDDKTLSRLKMWMNFKP
jgi:hypothetical protein